MTAAGTDWMPRGSCTRFEPQVWDTVLPAMQRRVCVSCVVREECLQWTLEQEAAAGALWTVSVVGGLTPKERRKVIRARREMAATAAGPVMQR